MAVSTVRASIGAALFPAVPTSHDELLRRADTALYAAKRDGKGRLRYAGVPA